MTTTSRAWPFWLILLLVFSHSRSLDLQRRQSSESADEFQFVRIRYNSYVSPWGMSTAVDDGQWVPPWMHDYPKAERNFLKILSELTTVKTTPQSFLILDLDDPEIMKYPVLYVSEPGYWDITQREADNLQEYLRRGGFVIFDDFRGQKEWNSFTSCMKQVSPGQSFRELSAEHPVFHCFYDIDPERILPPYAVPGLPKFYGLFDAQGRLQAVANFNNDIGDYWEWSEESIIPIDLSNEAYKFGINYVIFALTH